MSPTDGATFNAGTDVTISAEARDPDGHVILVEILQDGAKLGQDEEVPYEVLWGKVLPGRYVLTARATDHQGATTTSTPVTISVLPRTNHPPVITSVAPQRVSEEESFNLFLKGDDPDIPPQILTYSIASEMPAGASLNANTGELTWTPTEAQGPSTNVITVRVTDNGSPPLSATTNFTIIVQEVNRPPVLSPIADQTLKAGESLSFQAVATDVDLPTNMLTFSLEGPAPTGAGIDPRTGHITWTPTAEQAPSTNRITVRVSDTGVPPLSDSRSFRVVVQPGSSAPTVTISRPVDGAFFAAGTTIEIHAEAADLDGSISQVVFYIGTTALSTNRTAPYRYSWFNVPVGDYVLSAMATDNQGLTGLSEPVRIEVSNESALVAIVRNAADPEINVLKEYLLDMGLTARVFDQENLSFQRLTEYKLVIWNDLGSWVEGLTDNDVAVFHQVFTNQIPLYFIGDALAGSTARLSAGQRGVWTELIHLRAASVQGLGGAVVLNPVEDLHPILKGPFGVVSDFAYTNRLEGPKLLGTSAGVLGQWGGADVLVAFPEDVYAQGLKTFTQNFRVTGGGDAGSVAERKKLFQNAVCWLLQCRICTALSLRAEMMGPEQEVRAGEPVVYTNLVELTGECELPGVVLTNLLSAGEQFKSAKAVQGTWEYLTNKHAVVFRIGRMTSALTVETSVTVIPQVGGTITNVAQVRGSGGRGVSSFELVTEVQGTMRPVLSLARLGDGQYELRLSGQSGQMYRIEGSGDLKSWVELKTFAGPNGALSWTEFKAAQSNLRFYRAVAP